MTKRTAEEEFRAKLNHADFRAIDRAQSELRSAIFREYAERVRLEKIRPVLKDEHTRRGDAIFGILNEALGYVDLSMFSAIHLETLEMAVLIWAETISAPDAEINAPEPDPVN